MTKYELSKRIQKSCIWCLKQFLASPGEVNRGKGVFCSILCANRWRVKTFLQTAEGWRIRRKTIHGYKEKARRILQKAVKMGKLLRLPCEICGVLPTQGHHTDYSQPLNVQWLCQSHHVHKGFWK